MSFLRTFRSNLILSTAPPSSYGDAERGTMRTGTSKGAAAASSAPAKPTSSGSRKNSTSRSAAEDPDRSAYNNAGRRSSSNSVGTMQNRSGSKHSSSTRYGKENPAPIVVYLDKQPDGKKQPTSILRTNTFTRHDDDVAPERVRHAVTRSDTFTINETNDEPINTGTYTRSGKISSPPTTDVFEPLYAKNISLSSQEQLPVVVDSRTYRKKSFKTSKPVQKVESFIKRFERTLFSKGTGTNDSKRQAGTRKGSTASEATIVPAPRFRDVGINCKLDEEEKFKAKLEAMKQSRQSSRDSLISHRERSLSPGKQRHFTTGTYDRRSSTSLSVQPLKEDANGYNSGRESVTPPLPVASSRDRSTLYRPTESSFLKSRQKEIEMGYSVVNKRQPGFYLPAGPDRTTGKGLPDRGGGKTAVPETNQWRAGRDSYQERPTNVRDRHYSSQEQSTSRRDTYQTLKDEYERQHQLQAPGTKPVGIASPRMSAIRTPADQSPPVSARKDSHGSDLPKYTFGTDLQQRRSRFQQFQKSFKKMDDSASEVSVQQSFFVPI
ncbi:uncharacterized protein LOC118509435 isoform X5 [Anopheles stephensi]|uniref:uncharacterized protein LOC118509435 isoform X5 n=1 Tax=Anopheles stephensi TaxID=30069 RepID=UPI001658878F|nr:uncharacterized protein LOC118509435 isoform X5 [Anopheles stephensi]XP_035905925.1 uncharacterized protein LOC118509435 isoform X5 [Anopheles stephensi]XP_035905926.1 uncharacterized protein LOC118509435 isoform X5 [Anopheles stephensi]